MTSNYSIGSKQFVYELIKRNYAISKLSIDEIIPYCESFIIGEAGKELKDILKPNNVQKYLFFGSVTFSVLDLSPVTTDLVNVYVERDRILNSGVNEIEVGFQVRPDEKVKIFQPVENLLSTSIWGNSTDINNLRVNYAVCGFLIKVG